MKKPRETGLILAQKLGYTSNDPYEALEFIRKASTEDVAINSVHIYHEMQVWMKKLNRL